MKLTPEQRRQLREELSGLVSAPELRIMAHDAGLPAARINFSGPVEWQVFEVMGLAERLGDAALSRLLREVQRAYPQTSPVATQLLIVLGDSATTQATPPRPEGRPPQRPDSSATPGGSADSYHFDVYLAHSHKDKAWVGAFVQRLRKDGVQVWLDEDHIKWGEPIRFAIRDGIKQSRHVILVMSEASMGVPGQRPSEWVEMETMIVTFLDPTNKSRRLLPLLLRDCDIPDDIRPLRYLDLRPPEALDRHYPIILRTLRGTL